MTCSGCGQVDTPAIAEDWWARHADPAPGVRCTVPRCAVTGRHFIHFTAAELDEVAP